MEVFCIATDIRGNRDLLGSFSRPLVRVGAVDAIAAAIDWLLVNPARAQEEVLNYPGVLSEYSEENVWRLHEELYASALRLKTVIEQPPRSGRYTAVDK